ncbi:MAG: Asp23/Gls24 family envelope stress response protein, partial [Candidatus Limnocylindrales bacterium]
MPERSVAGRSIVTRRAIVDIVRTAVQSSYGVTGFSDPSLGRRLLRWVGLDRPGIRLTTDGGVHLDLFVNVAFGMPVAEVARQVDSAVRYSLRHYIGTEVTSLTIHVDGLRYQPPAIERAEAIERTESTERPEPAREHPRDPAAAAGAKASRKRKP